MLLIYRKTLTRTKAHLINKRTRVLNTSNSETLIDHIIVDKSAQVEMSGVINTSDIKDNRYISITDHKLIYCVVKYQKEKKKRLDRNTSLAETFRDMTVNVLLMKQLR